MTFSSTTGRLPCPLVPWLLVFGLIFVSAGWAVSAVDCEGGHGEFADFDVCNHIQGNKTLDQNDA